MFNTSNSTDAIIQGWVPTSNDRGSIDILWSCSVTIILCSWVSVYPNPGSEKDHWYRLLFDKFNLFSINLLGPDFLFAIVLGQFCSARRSVQKSMDIPERNSADTLSRLITAFQAIWFLVGEIERHRRGLPMTTLELTTISFVMVMLATSIAWCRKPCIMKPVFISTSDGHTVESIREYMKAHVRRIFGINNHWRYYTRLAQKFHIPLFSRPVTSRPWNRVPTDTWLCPGLTFSPLAGCVLLAFSAFFLLAIYHAVFTIYGGFYYFIEMIKCRSRDFLKRSRRSPDVDRGHAQEVQQHEVPAAASTSRWGRPFVVLRKLLSVGEEDPKANVPLSVLVPVSITCLFYILSRLYIFTEDLISLRVQPAAVYVSVNKFLPFLD
ncbi:hypothetical protein BJX65DRAFT_315965 [Aspergillus insuetus]